jgi:hypothetical protein
MWWLFFRVCTAVIEVRMLGNVSLCGSQQRLEERSALGELRTLRASGSPLTS